MRACCCGSILGMYNVNILCPCGVEVRLLLGGLCGGSICVNDVDARL